MTGPACRRCGSPLVAAAAPPRIEHGTVAGVAEGAVVWRCPQDAAHEHGRHADAWRQVLDVIDVAERTRLRNTLRCAACHTPYALPGRRTSRSVTLVDGHLPAARLTFDLPVLRCTEDAVESLPPECLVDLRAVLDTLTEAR